MVWKGPVTVVVLAENFKRLGELPNLNSDFFRGQYTHSHQNG